jgi:DNA-binding PadR family transcriptional regulator
LVILGLLTIEPMSGYEIKNTIDTTISHFWSESYGQLYPALKKLFAEGLVSRTEAGEGRKRFVYAITEAGQAVLDAWMQEPPAPRVVRNELLLRLFFGKGAEAGTLKRHVAEERGLAQGTLAGLTAAQAYLEKECASDPSLPYWLLTLDLGRRSAQARVEWATHALKTLEIES